MFLKSWILIVSIIGVFAGDTPPNPNDKALMARYVVHTVDWMTIGTISTLDNVKGYPFANVKAVADGPIDNGTGIPYLLMTDLDLSGRDVKANNRISLLSTLAEVGYCKNKGYDSQDPRCPRVILSGRLVKITPKTEEYKFAHSALVARHSIIPLWEKVHKFYVAKIDLEQVCLLDAFGGASFVDVGDYLAAIPKYKHFDHNDIESDKNIDIQVKLIN